MPNLTVPLPATARLEDRTNEMPTLPLARFQLLPVRISRHITSVPQNRSGDLRLKAAEVLGTMPSAGDNQKFAALRLKGD
jgi:hypothetical protein